MSSWAQHPENSHVCAMWIWWCWLVKELSSTEDFPREKESRTSLSWILAILAITVVKDSVFCGYNWGTPSSYVLWILWLNYTISAAIFVGSNFFFSTCSFPAIHLPFPPPQTVVTCFQRINICFIFAFGFFFPSLLSAVEVSLPGLGCPCSCCVPGGSWVQLDHRSLLWAR